MMSKNSIVPFLKDYLIKFLTRPFLLDTNEIQDKIFVYKVVDGKATSSQVTVFPVNNGKEYIVENGLEEGETIIAEGAGLVQEGTVIGNQPTTNTPAN